MTHCFQAINIGTCNVWIVFPVSTCKVPHCVTGSLCCDMCVCVCACVCVCVCSNEQVETRGKEIRQSGDEQRRNSHTQTFSYGQQTHSCLLLLTYYLFSLSGNRFFSFKHEQGHAHKERD